MLLIPEFYIFIYIYIYLFCISPFALFLLIMFEKMVETVGETCVNHTVDMNLN